MSTTPTIPPPPANVVPVVPPIPDHIQRIYDELAERVTSVALALSEQTGEKWMVIPPDLSLDRHYQTFHLLAGQKVLAINRNAGYYQKRLAIGGRSPGSIGEQDIKKWHSTSHRITAAWNREPSGVARDIERKILVPYVTYLAEKHRTNRVLDKVSEAVRAEATKVAKVMKVEAPGKPRRHYENRYDVTLCACHKESIGVKVHVEAPAISCSQGTYGPVAASVTLSNLTPAQVCDVLKIGMKLYRDREYNLKRRKTAPTPAPPKNSWDE